MPTRPRPIEKFAQAVAKCSTEVKKNGCILQTPLLIQLQASVYGKCIVADYNSVHKDKCLTEFLRLKDCYIVRSLSERILFNLLIIFRRLRRRSEGLRKQIIKHCGCQLSV